MFLILILLYPILVLVVVVALNQKGLLPGTFRYKLIKQREEGKFQVEASRQAAIVARNRAKENDFFVEAQKVLEAPKT